MSDRLKGVFGFKKFAKQVKINPLFYEDSLRLRVYNIEGKNFLKLSR